MSTFTDEKKSDLAYLMQTATDICVMKDCVALF